MATTVHLTSVDRGRNVVTSLPWVKSAEFMWNAQQCDWPYSPTFCPMHPLYAAQRSLQTRGRTGCILPHWRNEKGRVQYIHTPPFRQCTAPAYTLHKVVAQLLGNKKTPQNEGSSSHLSRQLDNNYFDHALYDTWKDVRCSRIGNPLVLQDVGPAGIRTDATDDAKRKCKIHTLLDIVVRIGCAVGLLRDVRGVLCILRGQRYKTICDRKIIIPSIYGRQ